MTEPTPSISLVNDEKEVMGPHGFAENPDFVD
jgi:hypothetical protein